MDWERVKLERRIEQSFYVSLENEIGYERISRSIAHHLTCVFTVNTDCGHVAT